jgi:hypothetical protein
MNNRYLFILLLLLGWGCTDKKQVQPDVTKYEVSFSIDGIVAPSSLDKQQSLAASSIYDEVQNVTLFIYNSKGYLVGEYLRSRGSSSSVFVASMEAGTYTAVAVGYGSAFFSNIERFQTARTFKDWPDPLFVDKVEFNVGASETGLVTLTLERRVGLLDLDITDEPGNEVGSVSVKMEAMPTEFTFRDLLPAGDEKLLVFNYNPYFPANDNFPAYFLVPNNSESYKTTVTLEVLNFEHFLIKTIVLKDVTVGVNRKTTIRGKLFDPGSQDFQVEVEDEWTGEDIIDF